MPDPVKSILRHRDFHYLERYTVSYFDSGNFLVSAIARVERQRSRNKKFTISGCRMLVQSSIYSLKMSNLFQLVFEVCMISTSANKLKQTKHVTAEI